MMLNLKKLQEDITDIVIDSLHYFDTVDTIQDLKTASEVTAAIEGGVARYEHDVIFHAKVQTMVVQIMHRLSKENVGLGPIHPTE